ncbi:MAG TPA: class I SAM-dependent methyltransferase [Firmicutes bacterium]|nr:class I SAM-dependent methyltransferase [Bacillota bacterium]
MNVQRLDPRLALCASLIRPGSRVADIGTDHGYLPAYLVGSGVCPQAVATDLRPGPLSRAAETVAQAGLAGRIALRLGDGLSPIRPEEIDDVVIAGMGGETIAAILAAAPWRHNPRYRLILQPMSRPEALRAFLFEDGFAAQAERVAQEGKRLYTVLLAAYAPEEAAAQAKRPAAAQIGSIDPADPPGRAYLLRQAERMAAAASALRRAGDAGRAGELEQTARSIRRYTRDLP